MCLYFLPVHLVSGPQGFFFLQNRWSAQLYKGWESLDLYCFRNNYFCVNDVFSDVGVDVIQLLSGDSRMLVRQIEGE